MSARALKKLRREQEEAKQLAALQAEKEEQEQSDDEDEELLPTRTAKRPLNAFDMLDGTGEDEDSQSAEAHDEEEQMQGTTVSIGNATPGPSMETRTPPSRKKKKKPKRKTKNKSASEQSQPLEAEEGIDEIDRALKELSAKSPQPEKGLTTEADESMAVSEHVWELDATKLLAIDSKHLNPVNEMKSLFGNIALQDYNHSSAQASQRQRDQTQQGGVDLGTALTGRYSPASKGKELGALSKRRNCFVQGHEDWPLGTSGGLSMDSDGTLNHFERHFSIVHNNLYSDTQRQFHLCVRSMQAESMIQLLMLNPYHIATLLQVSEIAKHQGDHSVDGDLVERALFSMGRSVHSSFPAALREGTARFSFNKPENRELYLAVWRYVQNLGQRGTWRTAYEWGKILLQFNTLYDPYGMTLMIDQLALRGRQHSHLIDLCSEDAYGKTWSHLPNIQISLALAYQRSSRPKLARETLALAMHKYPYILSHLASALDISPLPKALWAKSPSTDAEKLYTELYVTGAKDLWNTPETTSLIAEVAETLPHYKAVISKSSPAPKLEISLEEARHIMLLEIPALIALLPRKFTNMPTSSSDVLPPPDSLSDLTQRAPASASDNSAPNALNALFNAAAAAGAAPVTGIQGLLSRALNWFHAPAEAGINNDAEGQAAIQALQDQLGPDAPPGIVEQLLAHHMAEEDSEFDEMWAGRGADDEMFEYDSADSLPDLEQMPIPRHVRRPPAPDPTNDDPDPNPVQGPVQRSLAPTVEDDSDSDTDSPHHLRPHPAHPTHHVFGPRDPEDRAILREASNAPPPPAAPAPPRNHENENDNDPQRIQRWLLSTGLTGLQANTISIGNYVSKLKQLRQRDRDWTVGIVRQRAGREVGDRVAAAL